MFQRLPASLLMMAKKSIYEEITEQIISELEQGQLPPWKWPWRGEGTSMPLRANGTPYRGINILLLQLAAHRAGFESHRWLTFKQAKAEGGHVRKGESGTRVVFWKLVELEDEDGEETTIAFARSFTVFNADQCDGLPKTDPLPTTPHEPITAAARIVQQYQNPPSIEHRGTKAYYTPSSDSIRLPAPERYHSPELYYSVLFHELAHSTGHRKRLDRSSLHELKSPTSHAYAREELVAEIASAFLCGQAGIFAETIQNQAAYCKSWLSVLREDPKLIVWAAGRAQKAADMIQGKTK